MTNTKLHSPWPWFLLAAFLGLVPVLNNKYPSQFFPALPPGLVEVLSVLAGVYCATEAFRRGWSILQRRAAARTLVLEAVRERKTPEKPDPNDAPNSNRLISRLVRNAEADLSEIGPDFSMESLRRLGKYLRPLLEEVGNEEDARVRLGVVGTYLGETLCRNRGWQWFFKADPALNQFSFLTSVLQKEGKETDPYLWAGELLTGQKTVGDLLKRVS